MTTSCLKEFNASMMMPKRRVRVSLSMLGLLVGISLIIHLQYKPALLHHARLTFYYIGRNASEASQFVTFDHEMSDGRRLGNQLFNLAAVLYVAELTNRTAVIPTSLRLTMEDIFQLNLEHVSNPCPCYALGEHKHLSYDLNLEKLNLSDQNIANRTIVVSGYRQSWKYTLAIERRIRRHLVFKDEILCFAESFLRENIPRGWTGVGFVRVGIHVRRGDVLEPDFMKYGYTCPNETYFPKAMRHFTDLYSRVQFIVTSDDLDWCKKNITADSYNSSATINVTYSYHHGPGQDMALLSMCDHVIMSTGSFGWWAAWLAKGTTIYYSDWPRKGSQLDGHFTREDFFPPYWIPMTD